MSSAISLDAALAPALAPAPCILSSTQCSSLIAASCPQLGAGVAALVLHGHNMVLALACCRSAHTEGRLLDEDLDTRDFVSM